MSLNAIKEALSQYEDMIGTSTSEIGTAAQAEIAALEKAAKDLVAIRLVETCSDVAPSAVVLIATIAKETE